MAFGSSLSSEAAKREESYCNLSPASKIWQVQNTLLKLQSWWELISKRKPDNLIFSAIKMDDGQHFANPSTYHPPFAITLKEEIPHLYEKVLHLNPEATFSQIVLEAGKLMFKKESSQAKEAFEEGFLQSHKLPGLQITEQSELHY
ncbi:MAG: hypothetical protein ACREN8_08380 [Candidatus Dormibacteraceae bacterium]